MPRRAGFHTRTKVLHARHPHPFQNAHFATTPRAGFNASPKGSRRSPQIQTTHAAPDQSRAQTSSQATSCRATARTARSAGRRTHSTEIPPPEPRLTLSNYMEVVGDYWDLCVGHVERKDGVVGGVDGVVDGGDDGALRFRLGNGGSSSTDGMILPS